MKLVKRFFDNRFTRNILETDDPPEKIARGVAIGSFIAVTPTVGFQTYLTILVATILRGNRLAGVTMTFILNPFIVIPPSYWYFPAYYLGAFLLGTEPAGISRMVDAYKSADGLFELTGNFFSLGLDVFGPMFLGGAIIGVPVAFLMHRISLRIISKHRKAKQQTAKNSLEQGEEPDEKDDAANIDDKRPGNASNPTDASGPGKRAAVTPKAESQS